VLLRVFTILAVICLMAEAGQDPWQGRGRGRRFEPPEALEATIAPNFSFARVQFQSVQQRRNPGWSHDYPRAERNFLKILAEVSSVYTEPAAHTIVALASDEIMRYPVLYFSEPGTWAISQEEIENFRGHLARGGFAIFDDFDGPWDWDNFQACMSLVLPDQHLDLIPLEDPVFQSFFHIKSLEMTNPTGRLAPEFWGIRDDAGRVQVIANFNNDIGEYWEWSDQGYYPIELSNEGYKLGVNYIIYALTH
jgi:hypothetical protein